MVARDSLFSNTGQIQPQGTSVIKAEGANGNGFSLDLAHLGQNILRLLFQLFTDAGHNYVCADLFMSKIAFGFNL